MINIELEKRKKILLDLLYSKLRFGIKPGLERTKKLCKFAGNPEKKFKSIHIAGTNGKGSVCSFTASILMESGYKTGIYTSPHLIDFNERIQIDGKLITDEEIVEIAEFLLPEADRINATFFEITTVIAFKFFADNNIDIAVIETGMGGRFDSTNVIKPIMSIITSIGIDHVEYLGDTLEKIAYEKAGIIKYKVPVTFSKNEDELFEYFRKYSLNKNSHFIPVDNNFNLRILEYSSNSTMIVHSENFHEIDFNFESGLIGKYQLDNIDTVLTALDYLNFYGKLQINNYESGLKNVKINTNLRARFDILSVDPLIILDGAHNPDAFDALFETMEDAGFKTKDFRLCFAAMGDKNYFEMLKIAHRFTNKICLIQLRIPRAENVVNLAKTAIKAGFRDIIKYNSSEEFIKNIPELNCNLIIAGSFYLAGEILEQKNKLNFLKK
jgi:dihydrofolate synthase/folylpolyglutamate synthase